MAELPVRALDDVAVRGTPERRDAPQVIAQPKRRVVDEFVAAKDRVAPRVKRGATDVWGDNDQTDSLARVERPARTDALDQHRLLALDRASRARSRPSGIEPGRRFFALAKSSPSILGTRGFTATVTCRRSTPSSPVPDRQSPQHRELRLSREPPVNDDGLKTDCSCSLSGLGQGKANGVRHDRSRACRTGGRAGGASRDARGSFGARRHLAISAAGAGSQQESHDKRGTSPPSPHGRTESSTGQALQVRPSASNACLVRVIDVSVPSRLP